MKSNDDEDFHNRMSSLDGEYEQYADRMNQTFHGGDAYQSINDRSTNNFDRRRSLPMDRVHDDNFHRGQNNRRGNRFQSDHFQNNSGNGPDGFHQSGPNEPHQSGPNEPHQSGPNDLRGQIYQRGQFHRRGANVGGDRVGFRGGKRDWTGSEDDHSGFQVGFAWP